MARLTLDLEGRLTIAQELALERLPEAQRRRLMNRMGQELMKASRRRLREQRTVDGLPFEKRKDGRKERLLRRLGRGMQTRSTSDAATVTWSNALTAQIAFRHQHGVPEEFDAAKMQKIHGRPNYDAPATRRQAIALRNMNYRIRRAGTKGWKRPSLRWMEENLKQGQAGVILRSLRDEAGADSVTWLVEVPARPFLGANREDRERLVDVAVKELTRNLKTKR